MDYHTLATYHGAGYTIGGYQDYHYHRNENGHVFETSFIREGVRDNECLVNYACSKDDATFIDAAAEGNGKRVSWVFQIIEGIYDAEEEVETIVTALLEGKEEDIWLWVDGDEDLFPVHHSIPRLRKYEHRAAVQALRRRQEAMPRWESRRNAEMRGRVQLESRPVRIAAITWLIISSKTLKKLDHDHGRSDRIEWNLGETIWEWHHQLDRWLWIWNDLPEVSAGYMKEFKASTAASGWHSCHRVPFLSQKSQLARWLYIQGVLFGESAGKAVNFMHRPGPYGGVECKGCLYYESHYSYYYPLEQHPSYEPSKYSVLLAVLFFSSIHSKGILGWASRLRCSYPHLFTTGEVLSKTFMENLPLDPPDTRYLPWVNAYPEDWRWCLTFYSSERWQLIDALSNQETLSDTQPDSMTWLLAMFFSIAMHHNESKSRQIQDFYDLVKEITVKEITFVLFINGKPLNWDDIKVAATSVVANFCRKVKNSAHTCWNNYDSSWYAAAVAYFYDKDDIEFVPLLQPDCQQCALTCAARTFADEILDPISLSSSTSKEALEDLLLTMRSRYEQSSEIVLLRTTFDRIVNGSSSGSANDDLHAAEASAPHDQLEAVIPIWPVEVSGTLSTAPFPVPEVSERTEDWLHLNERSAPTTTQGPILKLSHDDMLDEVRNFLINALLEEKACLNFNNNKGEYTLPWSQLRSKLRQWDIEMVNWPEKVPLKDKKKGINGLNSHFVQLLYRAIHDKERPLHFRRITQTAAGESRKRTALAGDRDDTEAGPSAKRPNISDRE